MASPKFSNLPNGNALQFDPYDVLSSRRIRASSKDTHASPMSSSPSMFGRLFRKRIERHHRLHAPSAEFQEAFQTLPPLNTYGPSMSMPESSGNQLPPQDWSSPPISPESLRARATEAGMDLDVASQLQGYTFQRLRPIPEEPEHSQSRGCQFVQPTLEIPYRDHTLQSVQPTFETPYQGHNLQSLQPTVEEPAQDQSHVLQTLHPTVEDAMPDNTTDAMSLVTDSASLESHARTPPNSPPSSGRTLRPHPPPTPRQHDLFLALERICTSAARAYYLSQFDSPFSLPSPLVIRHPRRQHANYLFHPYHPYHIPHPYHPYPPPPPPPCLFYPPDHPYYVPQLPFRAHRTLIDYIVSIAHKVWERALELGDHAAEAEAVQRMGRLYTGAERVMRAAKGGRMWEGASVRDVVLAARDLAAWLLCEEGVREVEALWRGWGGGGVQVRR